MPPSPPQMDILGPYLKEGSFLLQVMPQKCPVLYKTISPLAKLSFNDLITGSIGSPFLSPIIFKVPSRLPRRNRNFHVPFCSTNQYGQSIA